MGNPNFENILKVEIQEIEPEQLPLQKGLSQTCYVFDSDTQVLVLNIKESESNIIAKTGIFYEGIITGSCCDSGPTPVCEQTEYCEVQFNINKLTAEATVALLEN